MEHFIDYRAFFSFHIFVFKIFGFWRPDSKMNLKEIYLLYTFIGTTTWVLFLLSQFIYMLKNLDNVDELMAVSYLAGPFIVNLFKMLTIYKNMDRIKVLMRKLNDPLFQPNSKKQFEIAMKTKKFHRNFFYLCLYLGVQTYLCFMILPFLREKKTIPTQGKFVSTIKRNLIKCYFF